MIMNNVVHRCDCMDLMKDKPDKFYDLAPVDPGYGNGEGKSTNETRGKFAKAKAYKKYDDTRPDSNYFKELFRASKSQIIWGGNYFISDLKDTPCLIVWDKKNGKTDYADCEIAWTSFETATRIFRFKWQGMLQENMKNKEIRIHRHQKPVALYKWLLQNYAKPGWKIFDSHVGSGSLRIACYDMGFWFEGCEIDKDYWQAQEERFQNHIAQPEIFDKQEIQENIFQEQKIDL